MTDVVKRVTINEEGHVIENPRDQLVARLRAALGWVSARDHDIAIELDSLVEALEANATSDLRAELEVVRKERDSAWADLFRVYKIVKSPMVLMESEFRAQQINADAVIADINDDVEHSTSANLVHRFIHDKDPKDDNWVKDMFEPDDQTTNEAP